MRASGTSKRSRVRTALAALAIGSCAAALAVGCSEHVPVPSVGYAMDNVITTYNGNTADGAPTGARQAFGRVLTGMNYVGPQGDPVVDTDYGTVNVVPGEALTLQYRLNPSGVYSDGAPTSCDDLVLAWVARSGKFTRTDEKGVTAPLFNAANTAGYADIDRVECQPGSKDATVVFRPGRGFVQWKTLFGATELMPAHVAARVANVPNIVTAVQSNDRDGLRRVADFWNSGWALVPGQLDLSLLPSSGPYRIESFTKDNGLVLVANERWWGNKPATPRIVVWDKTSDVKSKVGAGAVQVLDVGAESVPGLELKGFDSENLPSRGVEQLVLSTRGVFESADVRRAFAMCVPRQALFDRLGHPNYNRSAGLGSAVLNSRLVAPDNLVYASAAAAEGGKFNGDSAAASAALGGAQPTVRIGYLGPDDRRAKTVAAIADSCKNAGITVQDTASGDFSPQALRDGTVDAVLAGPAAAAAAAGSGGGVEAMFALRSGAGTNYGGFDNPRYTTLVDQLAGDGTAATQLSAATEAETILWSEMPTIPLFNTPRTVAFADGMRAGVPNPAETGAGWNMDRWVLER